MGICTGMSMCVGMGVGIHAYMHTCTFTGMCAGMGRDMCIVHEKVCGRLYRHAGMRVGVGIGVHIDMCVGMRVGRCTSKCTDMCIGMGRDLCIVSGQGRRHAQACV